MRGKRAGDTRTAHPRRITPAHAGKTHWQSSGAWQDADHPRACGENLLHLLYAVELGGSPPRMRGKPMFCRASASMGRITPAHAGKTYPHPLDSRSFADHPRACGENSGRPRGRARGLGSPPRMRGKQALSAYADAEQRITPAHAGKTGEKQVSSFSLADHPRACGENTSEMAYFRG